MKYSFYYYENYSGTRFAIYVERDFDKMGDLIEFVTKMLQSTGKVAVQINVVAKKGYIKEEEFSIVVHVF